MSPEVDHTLIARYLAGELDDAASADVEEQVASSPEWASALQKEAQLEMALFEVVDAIPTAVPTTPGMFERMVAWLRQPMGITMFLAVAAAMLLVVRMPAGEAPAYQMLATSGDVQIRSADRHREGPAVYSRGSALDLSLTPETAWSGRPEVQVLLDGVSLEGLEITRLEGGGVRLYGIWGEGLPMPETGRHSVAVMLSMPDGTVAQHVHAMETR